MAAYPKKMITFSSTKGSKLVCAGNETGIAGGCLIMRIWSITRWSAAAVSSWPWGTWHMKMPRSLRSPPCHGNPGAFLATTTEGEAAQLCYYRYLYQGGWRDNRTISLMTSVPADSRCPSSWTVSAALWRGALRVKLHFLTGPGGAGTSRGSSALVSSHFDISY